VSKFLAPEQPAVEQLAGSRSRLGECMLDQEKAATPIKAV
jgi:hypothetical protein